jgi:NADH-quinone oxidoreductase subunit F
MTITDPPKIVTARLGHTDSHTLERYLATGGYDGLRKALLMTPEAVTHEVDAASLLGRGGAGFPAGRKWGMLRKNPVTYLVVNGDESEPATFKDHLLVERDPHQLIEGVLIAAYALQVSQVFIFVRGEFALGLERVQAALNEAYAHGAVGTDIFGSGFSVDVVVHPGAGAYICGEETALLESLEGKRGFPRIKPSSTTSRPCPTCRGSCSTEGPPSPPSARAARRGRACSPWPVTSTTPVCTSSRWSRPPSTT